MRRSAYLLLWACALTGCTPVELAAQGARAPDPVAGTYLLDADALVLRATQAGVPVPPEARALLRRMRHDLVLQADGHFSTTRVMPEAARGPAAVTRMQGTWHREGDALLLTPLAGSRDGVPLPAYELRPLRAVVLPQARLHMEPAGGMTGNPFLLRRR